jgi:hypothetical protein
MREGRVASVGRAVAVVVTGAAVLVLVAAWTTAFMASLTRIPLGRGTATITWTGATGITPTIQSISGNARGYTVSGHGHVPQPPPGAGTATSIPSQIPVADVAGTIGGSRFTLNITLTFPASVTSKAPQNVGSVSGTFRNEPVRATLTANITSRSFAFAGTIGSLHVSGVISQPTQHGRTETAHARFDVTA